MADRKDFYEELGVQRDATAEEIQRAYRKLARTYHPDINKDPGAEQRFKEVSEAYDVLSNPDTRKRYDAFGHDFRRVPEDVDPEAYARSQRAGAGSPFDGFQSGGFQGGFGGGFQGGGFQGGFGGDDVDLDDLFGSMFGGGGMGGGRSRRQWGPIPGADQEVVLELTVEEAYEGVKRSLAISGPEGTRNVEVTIPPGVTEGQRIRMAGQGGRGTGDAPAGDLYLIVELLPNDRFQVEGRNIYVDLPISAWEAALGATVPVDTPGGSAKVKVPALTSSGKRLRLRGRGMPSRSGKPGDLFAEIRIVMPTHLSDEEKELLEKVAAASTFDPRSRR